MGIEMTPENVCFLLDEVRWLSDTQQVKQAWTDKKTTSEPGVDASEYYSILFDDLDILNVASIPELSDYQKTVILEFAQMLKTAAKKDRLLYDVPRLLEDPHFRIAQRIASLL